jgi:hypothetical protein
MITAVCTNRVDFRSAARDHEASVRFEIWPGEPPGPEGNWTGGDMAVAPVPDGTERYLVQLWKARSG